MKKRLTRFLPFLLAFTIALPSYSVFAEEENQAKETQTNETNETQADETTANLSLIHIFLEKSTVSHDDQAFIIQKRQGFRRIHDCRRSCPFFLEAVLIHHFRAIGQNCLAQCRFIFPNEVGFFAEKEIATAKFMIFPVFL